MNKEKKYPKIENFKELVEFSTNRYKNSVAYEYKKDFKSGDNEIIKKTYQNVGNDVKALATALLNKGFSKKKIAIISSNRYEWVISYFSIEAGGMVAAPMDKMLPSNEIELLIERSSIDAVIFEKEYLDIFKEIKQKNTNNLDLLICMDNVSDESVIKLSDLLRLGDELRQNGDKTYENTKIDTECMSVMLFTSGTTDKSKIVMLSQQNILSNICAYPTHFKMLHTDRLLSILPIHHTFECNITITYGFYCGVLVAFSDGLRYIQNNLKEYGITIFLGVPLLIENMYKKINRGIIEQGEIERINKMTKISNRLLKYHIDIRRMLFKPILNSLGGHIRILLYGAASMDKEIVEGFSNFGLSSMQGYGLTETSPVLTGESYKIRRMGSAGFPLDNVQIKIYNPDKDGIGEIVAKGPNIFLGYYNDRVSTDNSFVDGWFRTGDLGYIDREGFLYITGRKNDMIVLSNGKNVYPEEIEQLINKLPYVKESLVFTRNSSKMDTMLMAKIVYDEHEMKSYFPDACKDQYKDLIWNDIDTINKSLVSYKSIKQIVITNIEMEKTTTKKIKRFQEIKKIQEDDKKNNSSTVDVAVKPSNETEDKILECMQNVLDNYTINIESDFFEAGGDSLSAIDLQVNLAREGIELNTQEIYDNPSARKIYNYITEHNLSDTQNEVMQVNIVSTDVEMKERNNIFLTGATGYLGIHILNELLKSTNNNIYCIVRHNNNLTSEERLIEKYKYYFKRDNLEQYMGKRVFIIDGDLSKPNFNLDDTSYNELSSKIDIVLNVAAAVTHYGNRQRSYDSNVATTNNALKLAIDSGALFNHISTIGLAGNNLVNTNKCIKDSFSENDLVIGQAYRQNVYISTKLEAEKLIIDKIKSNEIKANIMRVGNLMNRYSDNLFQDNKDSNAFQNKMREIVRVGYIPENFANDSFDLTPVDLCAEAVVKLMLYTKYNNVYHVLNDKELEVSTILKHLKRFKVNVKIAEPGTIPNEVLTSKWLINDFLLKNKRKIKIDSEKTVQTLEKLGFKWKVGNSYYIKVFKNIING